MNVRPLHVPALGEGAVERFQHLDVDLGDLLPTERRPDVSTELALVAVANGALQAGDPSHLSGSWPSVAFVPALVHLAEQPGVGLLGQVAVTRSCRCGGSHRHGDDKPGLVGGFGEAFVVGDERRRGGMEV